MGVQIPSNMPHPEHSRDVAVKAESGWAGDGEPTFENEEQELASDAYIRSFAREGRALLGLGRSREAVTAFEAGLRADPLDPGLRAGLQSAQQRLAEEALAGGGQVLKALTYPEPKQRIAYHPASAPLHRIKTDDMLPLRLLTPFQAENDHAIKDTVNYVTVQTDIRMPRRHIKLLEDSYCLSRLQAGVRSAVEAISAGGERDVRVIDLAAGAGVLAATALAAGARHVTAVERWLYLALTAKEILDANGFHEDRVRVVYKRPTDLQLVKDVPVCANLILAPLLLDEGLLSSGLIPSVQHVLSTLATADALVLPASATVWVQAVEVATGRVAGLNMQAADARRWAPAYLAEGRRGEAGAAVRALSRPREAWHFDLAAPPTHTAAQTLDLEFEGPGRWNAVRFWFDLRLHGDATLSTGPDAAAAGLRCLGPGLQYLQGAIEVLQGDTHPLLATHNTVRMRFDVEDAAYAATARRDAAFPPRHLAMLADGGKYEAYARALRRAAARLAARDGEVHALDAGTGAGALAILAAKVGATSVVAVDLHEPLADLARQTVAANCVSDRVSVVHRDIACLQRGRDVRALGVNLVVADLFDAGLLGDGVQYLLDMARKRVMQPGAITVPAAATVYCIGIEACIASAGGFDVSLINKYRWDDAPQNIRLSDFPHRVLTRPAKAAEFFFDGEKRGRVRDTMLKLEVVAPGNMNAIVYWFDLHLDDVETLSNAPPGVLDKAGSESVQPTEPRSGEDQPPSDFEPAPTFQGRRPGWIYGTAKMGTGYYRERDSVATTEERDDGGAASSSQAADPAESRACAEAAPKDAAADPEASAAEPPHYWGQAMQTLDFCVAVRPGKTVSVVVRREPSRLNFALRQGVGEEVARPPWKEQWGGGASVENPHVQRVHYCELLVRDFLMRVKSRRFPPIEEDMRMVLAHCGSLILDTAALQQVYHELVVLEKINQTPEFSPGATLEAITRPALELG
ncbi:Protein arginine N-methyltransferase 7 [Auxenochlorella protothecoides]|uniref:Protein arginine N-methyltransferase 7 n=1 Tax=Auxenochlorella protothecoides TaxID=3075 RepID=A0A087STV4_AUXPR|nr:Protein arginine N-methyltransferase 7 [Auxenochlorella protothecoides]KFM29158.1 Protein arginine N-methyltransferase 7 [Auxenochlorella protothecoides]